jgi:hypothetical protein
MGRRLLAGSWLVLLVVENLLWVRRTLLPAPPPWDPALYLFMSLRYWHALAERGFGALWREIQDRNLVPYVPPLFPLSALPAYAFFGESRLAAYATSSAYLVLVLVATALLARRRDVDGAPLLALFLLSTFSAPIRLSRDYHMDLPATAWLALSVWSLLRAEGFRRTGFSAAFGAFLGLGLLTKTMSGPFFVAPALYALVHDWPRRGEGRRVLRNAGLALAIAALVASAWWAAHSRGALWYLLYYGWGAGAEPYTPSGTAGLFSAASLTYYLAALANQGASVPFLVLALVLGLVAAWRRTGERDPTDPAPGLLWTWLLAGYLVLTSSRNKTADRYVVFLVPPLAALVARGVADLPRAAWRLGFVLALALAGLANYVALTWPGAGIGLVYWGPPLGLKSYSFRQEWLRSETPVPEEGWPVGAIVEELSRSTAAVKERPLPALLAEAPSTEADPEEQVRRAYRILLRRDADPTGLEAYTRELRDGTKTWTQLLQALASSPEFRARPLRALVVPDHPFVNASTLRYYTEVLRRPLVFDRVAPGSTGPWPLDAYDALVVKDGGLQGPAFSTTHVAWFDARLREGHEPIETRSFPCPDGSRVRLLFYDRW